MSSDQFNLDQVVFDDFENIIADIGVNVTLARYTKTLSNIVGDEDVSTGYAAGVTIKGVFQLNERMYEFSKEGIVEQGDAAFYARSADSVDKDDKITYDSKTYIITKKTKRNNVALCTLELWTK